MYKVIASMFVAVIGISACSGSSDTETTEPQKTNITTTEPQETTATTTEPQETTTTETTNYNDMYQSEWDDAPEEIQSMLCMGATIGGAELKDVLIAALEDGESLTMSGSGVTLTGTEAEQAAIAFIEILQNNC